MTKRLRVALDGRLYGRRGVGRYVSALAGALKKSGLPLDLRLCLRAGLEAPVGMESSPLPEGNYARLEQKGLPRAALGLGADILHMADNMGALEPGLPQVITVHDLFFLDSPRTSLRGGGWKAWAAWLYRRRYFERSLAQARKIICPSSWSAGVLENRFPQVYRRLVVARLGVGLPFSPEARSRAETVRNQLGLEASWILVPGAAARRKNVAAAVQGFLLAQGRGFKAARQLAIFGLDHEALDRHWPELSAFSRSRSCKLLGTVPDEDLASLYAGSWCTLFPSLGEGAGLPALEALACGSPLITSRLSALPEYIGDAGLYTDGSAAQVAERLLELESKPGLRESLSTQGPARASLFSWASTAEAHWGIYRSCLPSGGPA